MHPKLSVSALSSMNLRFDEDLELWAQLGVDTVGLFLPKLTAAGVDAAVARVIERRLAVSSLAARGFTLCDRASWDADRAALDAAVDVADAVDAGCLFVTGGTPGPLAFDECVVALGDALGPVRDRAAGRGVRVAVEHTNPLRRDVGFVHTLRDVVDLARRLDIGVCVEVNACWAERALGTTIRDDVDTFRIVQVSDYAVGTLSTPNRLVPGDGDIPLERILGQVLTAGYGGAFDLELIGPRIDEEGYAAASRRAIERLGTMLDALGV